MKTALKILAALVAAYIVFLVIAANFSAVPTKYKCSGNQTLHNETKHIEVFMLLKEYRWWVGLWSKSEGAVHIEAPNSLGPVPFLHVSNTEMGLGFWSDKSDVSSGGSFSKLSKRLYFSSPYSLGTFDGTCKEL